MAEPSTSSIRITDRRERLYECLEEATGEDTRVGALDVAANYYLEMAGGTAAHPTGALEELMQRAVEQGSVTAPEIAEVLDVDELPIDSSYIWSVNRDEGDR